MEDYNTPTGLLFTLQFITLLHQLQYYSHDVDNIRYHICLTVETLLLSVDRAGLTNYYCPLIIKQHVAEDPKHLHYKLADLGKLFINMLHDDTNSNQVDHLSDLMEVVDLIMDPLFKIGNFHHFDHFAIQAMEYRKQWPKLKTQRDKIIQLHPHLKYQLESKTVFPLRYTMGHLRHNNPITTLLNTCNIIPKPNRLIVIQEVKDLLVQAIKNMKFNLGKSHNEIARIIATATNTKPKNIDFNNYYSLINPCLNGMTKIFFSDVWARAYPEIPALEQVEITIVEDTRCSRPVPVFSSQPINIPVVTLPSDRTPFTPIQNFNIVHLATQVKTIPVNNKTVNKSKISKSNCKLQPKKLHYNSDQLIKQINTSEELQFTGLPGVQYSPISP